MWLHSRSRLALVIGLALLLGGCGELAKFDFGRPFGRSFWQRPAAVVAALEVEPGDTVADLGAGDGYFLPWLSRAVGPEGQVIAVEVSDANVALLFERVADDELDNVRVIRGKLDDPRLPAAGVDVVLLVNTYHHIDEREAYFARLRGALAPGGRVAVIDPNDAVKGPLRVGITRGHASLAPEVRAEMRAAGYRLRESHEILALQIFEVFEPDAQR